MSEKSLSIIIENTRSEMTMEFNRIIQNSHLPAYLIEGILLGILADVRNIKTMEIMNDSLQIVENQQTHEEEVHEVVKTEEGEE